MNFDIFLKFFLILVLYDYFMCENSKEIIKNIRQNYRKLESIECPAFNNEKVYFNHHGISHLIYKDRIPRDLKEIEKRYNFLLHVPKILKTTKIIDSEEKRVKNNSIAYFWTIKKKVSDTLYLRIILRRLNNGVLHFFSVMSE